MTKTKIFQRILQILVLLFGISFITFSLMYLAPGDAVEAMYSVNGGIPNEEVMEIMRENLGLNKPFTTRYFDWLSNCLKGDLGVSFMLNKPVTEIILDRIGPTITLALSSLIITIIISIPLALLSAVNQNKFTDYFIRFTTFIGTAMPNFWIGLILIYFVSVRWGLLPIMSTGTGFKQIILPSLTLAISMTAKYTRQIRIIVLEELNQEYVIGARTRGISENKILFKHIIPNAIIPIITLIGLSFGSLLGGTAVVEAIFSYQGLGYLGISAITARDYPLIQGYVLFVALMYMIVNNGVDILYEILDTRIKG